MRWKPKLDERYYQAICGRDGKNGATYQIWDNSAYDQAAWAMGDVFQTWEEARDEFHRRCKINNPILKAHSYVVIADFPNGERKIGDEIPFLPPSIAKFLEKHGFIKSDMVE